MTQADSVHSTPPTNTPIETTRRHFLTVAAGGAVAALPVAAPANSNPLSPDLEIERATLARIEQIVDLLRTCYVREGWKIDDKAADRALAYFRRRAEGPPFKNEDEDPLSMFSASIVRDLLAMAEVQS
jgi:hypothetical protein